MVLLRALVGISLIFHWQSRNSLTSGLFVPRVIMAGIYIGYIDELRAP